MSPISPIIANGIEAEQQVIRLLDYNIRYAQGELFAPPKAVRAEVLDAINEAPPGQARRARRGAPIAG